METRRGAARGGTGGRAPRRILAASAIGALGAAALGAEAPGAGATAARALPESLFLEILTAPGYLWMGGCGEPGAAAGAAGDPVAPAAAEPLAGAAGGAEEDGHAGHHGAAPGAPPPALDEAGLAALVGELEVFLSRIAAQTP